MNTSDENIKHPDGKTRRNFNIGDQVWVKKEIRNKDDDRYEGPYTIIEKIHEKSYKLEDKEKKQIVRNVEKFKNFKEKGEC
jgi:hypothetical protein